MNQELLDETPKGGHETLLIVDDRVQIATAAAEYFEALGYTALVAFNAADALAALERQGARNVPHLLFTDVVMPGGPNGYRLADEVRRIVPDIQVLLTTGFDKNAKLPSEAGDCEIIPKPYVLKDVASRVRALLDQAACPQSI